MQRPYHLCSRQKCALSVYGKQKLLFKLHRPLLQPPDERKNPHRNALFRSPNDFLSPNNGAVASHFVNQREKTIKKIDFDFPEVPATENGCRRAFRHYAIAPASSASPAVAAFGVASNPNLRSKKIVIWQGQPASLLL